MYPSYISYISGVTFGQGEQIAMSHRLKAMIHSLLFIMGFSLIFFALGLSASMVGQIFVEFRGLIRIIGVIIVILMGLHLSGLVSLKWLMIEKKWGVGNKKTGYLGSVLVGISFAAGWSPCIGPILSGVLILTATNSASGVPLIISYIIGFAIPFFILGFSLVSVRPLVKYGALLSKIAGYIMMLLGVMLITNSMSLMIEWLTKLYGGFTGF